MPMTPRTRPAVAALALALAIPVYAGCNAVDKAIDCAKIAATIAGDVQALQDSATNIGQIADASRREETSHNLDKIEKDIKSAGHQGDNVNMNKALDHLSKAVANAKDTAADGKSPDITPIAGAAGELTKVCGSG